MEKCNINFKNLFIKVYPEVYEPAEDSFQLLEAIDIKKDENLLEIGCGCGLIGLLFAKNGFSVVCSDINPYAVKNTKENYEKNKHNIKGKFEVRKGNIFSSIKKNEFFDIIIFNPPYLPMNKEDYIKDDKWFNISIDGGINGLKYTEKFIKNVGKHLKKNGRAFFVFSSLSNQKKLEKIIRDANLIFEIVNIIRYDDEIIKVFKIKKRED